MDKIPRDMMMNPAMKIRIRAHITSSPMAVRGSRKGRLEGKEAEIECLFKVLSSSCTFLTRAVRNSLLSLLKKDKHLKNHVLLQAFLMPERTGGKGGKLLYMGRMGAVTLKPSCTGRYTLDSLWIVTAVKNGPGRVFRFGRTSAFTFSCINLQYCLTNFSSQQGHSELC